MKVKYARRAQAALLLSIVGLGAGLGCSAALPQAVTVRWLLADGRSCLDAAVLGVTIQVDDSATGSSTTVVSPCPTDARTAGQLLIPGLFPKTQLQAHGLSSSSTVLYRGQLTVPDPVPLALDLMLYFTGGQ